MNSPSRSQPMTASAAVESCSACGGPLAAKRIILDGRTYHEGCVQRTSPETESPIRSFDTTGTRLSRTVSVITITCDSGEIADRVVDQLRSSGHAQTPAKPDARIHEMEEWNRLRAEDIINLGQQVGRLTQALEKIACPHVTEAPLWWQLEARAALADTSTTREGE